MKKEEGSNNKSNSVQRDVKKHSKAMLHMSFRAMGVYFQDNQLSDKWAFSPIGCFQTLPLESLESFPLQTC